MSMNLPSGYQLQREKYKLLSVIGQGGFGITYNGIWYTEVKGPLGTLKTEVPICIKEYFFKDYCFRDPETEEVKVHSETGKNLFEKFKEKLIKEAKILSDVTHPNIVNVLEVFEENNTAYIVMEYISGNSLKYMLEQEGQLPESRVLKYTAQIGEALQFVHDNNILHLDIKPSNILVDKNDNARLIDFGVSKRYDLESQETSTTMLTLSKGFASIEQYDDEGTQVFSPCPDIYSLGATMYNLLTGKIPTESILRATRPLVKPSEINPAITEKTEAAILKAMQIAPADRFPTAKEMIGALDIPVEVPRTKEYIPEKPIESEEETTLLINNDNTIVNPTELPSENKKKKQKRTAGIFLSLSLLVILMVVFLIQRESTPNADIDISGSLKEISTDPTLETLLVEANDKEQTELIVGTDEKANIEPEKNPEADNNHIDTERIIQTDTESNQAIAENNQQKVPETVPETESERRTSLAETEAKYSTLIASGKKKMDIFDFPGARNDFTEAKNVQITEEVLRLLISCDAKEAEHQIVEKMKLYEVKMTFGNLKIVRKVANEKYGAINDKAEEIIPCKYIMVGSTQSGRAFERDDHLYDIYNENGERLGEGLTYY